MHRIQRHRSFIVLNINIFIHGLLAMDAPHTIGYRVSLAFPSTDCCKVNLEWLLRERFLNLATKVRVQGINDDINKGEVSDQTA